MGTDPKHARLFIGTYTKGCDSKGIYLYVFDQETGRFEFVASSEDCVNPSFLCMSSDGRNLYAVNENGRNSTVSAYRLDEDKMRLLGKQDAGGADPCHLADLESHIITANYGNGKKISVFEKQANGNLSPAKQVITHHGSGPNEKRQEKAHVHMVKPMPGGEFVLASDLGTDSLQMYRFRPDSEEILVPHKKIPMTPGSGPRHFEFSPNGCHAYLIAELDGSVSVFSFSGTSLEMIQETSVVDENFDGEIGGGDIHLSADGKFLYATNRGEANTISVFSIGVDGRLGMIETISSKGDGPRNFAISPNGKYLLIGHQKSNEIVVFSRDTETGKLSDTGKRLDLCAPVCLKFG